MDYIASQPKLIHKCVGGKMSLKSTYVAFVSVIKLDMKIMVYLVCTVAGKGHGFFFIYFDITK